MKAVEIRDRAERERAAFSEENVAVTAGAGTGKTTLLVDAVLGRVLVHGISARRVLMLTFTEKAAAEMRLRLESKLKAILEPGPSREEWQARAGRDLDDRARGALAELDRVEISTIHGFCAHLLREFPIEAGLVPSFAVDEGPRFEETFEREWSRWLDVELRADSPRREEWLRVLPKVSLEELREVARGLSSFHVPEEAFEPGAPEGKERLREAAKAIATRLVKLAGEHAGKKNNLVQQMVDTAAFLSHPTPAGGETLPDHVSTAASGWPGEKFREASEAMEEALALAKDIARIDPELNRDARALAGSFARAFRALFIREGWAGFDALLTKARDLLASESFPEVRDQVKRKFDFIVIDEFQDTDPVQCEIALFLAEGARRAPTADQVKLARGKLFIVGDPKQSIYSFRGADIVAYERLKKRILDQGGSREVLRTNFRSHSGIIGAVNELFDEIIVERGELQPEYEEIFPLEGREPRLPSQQVEVLLFEGAGDRISSQDAREAEGEAIASWIAKQTGALDLPDREPGATRKLRLGDIAILLRALTDVHVLLDRLRAHGVKFVVEGEKYYFATPEVIDFVNLLRAIADPHDVIALAGLLRSPLGAVDDPTLYRLAKEGKLDPRVPDSSVPLFALLKDLHERHGRMTVPALIDEIFSRLEVLELAGLSWHGEQAVANLLKMRRAAEDFEASGAGSPTLRAFLRKVSRDIRDMTEEGESPLSDEGIDAVRIMSIHKAKGLEFPVVFLPDLHRSSPKRDDPPVRYDWPDRVLGIRHGPLVDEGGVYLSHAWRRRAEEEAKRVLYVAMTRARERLVLSGSADFRGSCYLSELSAALKAAGGPSLADGEGRVTAGDLAVEIKRTPWREAARKPAPAPASTKPGGAAWKKLDQAWRRRAEDRARSESSIPITSPSALQETKVEREWTASDEESRTRAADTGSLCHRVLEKIDFRKPEVEPLVEAGARELGIADPSEAREILLKFVESKAFQALAKAEILGRELPFLLPREGGLLQGVIDLVARIDGRLTVIDYKSDRTEHPEKYAQQKKRYVEAATRILGEKSADFRMLYLRTAKFA